jgi:beta-N-acetylhexosaminidase
VDVLTEAYSPNIGIRAYGNDPRRVAALAVARIRAMQAAGVAACAKHFPGLGPATIDPHLDLPSIDVPWEELRRHHLVPFQAAIKAGVDIIMSSHPLYPRLDPGTPATFSKKLITGLLRRELGYEGVISSDDLEMGALKEFGGIGGAAVRAVRAGHDMILVCHKAPLQREVFRALKNAYESGSLSVRELEKSAGRIDQLRRLDRPHFEGGAPKAEPSGQTLSRRIARKAVAIQGDGAFPRSIKKGSPCIIFPRLSEASRTIFVEDVLKNEKSFLRKYAGSAASIHIVPLDPRPGDIRSALAAARREDRTIFFCYEAHMKSGCRELLDALQKNVPNLVVVLLRTPYDRALIRPSIPTVTAFGYRACQIEACLDRLV